MSIQDLTLQGFYSPLGLKQYRCTHIQILEFSGNDVIFRFRDEFRAYFMSLAELMGKYEKLNR
jgi:hypothetical protein